MRFTVKSLLFAVSLMGFTESSKAFSLIGQSVSEWMANTIGYDEGDAAFGPMNLSEEYRLNVPRIYYAYDESFLNYFGQRGVDEIDKAMALLNEIPAASEIDINSYPLYATRVNHQAQALGLFDLKSTMLKIMTSWMGLTDPTRYVFTLRARQTFDTSTQYLVIKRNFDPDTWNPSSFINGQLWTYNSIFDNQDAPISYPVNEPVDPLLLAEPVAGLGWTYTRFSVGSYHTGFTRDDVGGLRYIYHPNNANVEPSHPGVVVGGTVNVGGGFSFGSDNPWTPVDLSGIAGTNATTGTQVIPDPSNPWGTPIFVTPTNATGGAVTTPGNTPLPPALTNAGTFMRLGIDKVTFVKTMFSPATGQLFPPFTDTYQERIVGTDGNIRTVSATRVIGAPDILISAQDLVGDESAVAINIISDGVTRVLLPDDTQVDGNDVVGISLTEGWMSITNNDALNGIELLNGPGNIMPEGDRITFDKGGPYFVNVFPGSIVEPSSPQIRLGSFDGSTNAPFIYPQGTTIQEIEDQIIGPR